MMLLSHFRAVLTARNREFLRDRSSWAWNVFFPVALIVGLALLLGDDNKPVYSIGVYPSAEVNLPLLTTRHISFFSVESIDDAIAKVDRHQIDLLLDTETNRYWINETSPKGYFAERILLSSEVVDGRDDSVPQYQRQLMTGKSVRYVDWVLPGVLGMNLMFSCVFGVGYVIVRYRKSGVLKRLSATPLRSFEFLFAQVVSRLWLVVAITTFVFVGTHLTLNFTVNGSYFSLLLILIIGALCLISVGMLFASRTASEELAGGLLNLATWPMILLSGVWFSLEGAQPWLQKLAYTMPLTHIVDAARSVMIDGGSLLSVADHLLFLLLMTLVCLLIGAALFKWE